jgi:hydroxyethylthiazole kinase
MIIIDKNIQVRYRSMMQRRNEGVFMKNFDVRSLLETLRREKPLVHNITNYVVMNFTANTLLAMGASPVMAHAAQEVEEMVSIARSLVLNIGTLSGAWIDAMMLAGRKANKLGVPVILDPVGSGATALRTKTFADMLGSLRLAVVRGNASEILSIASTDITTKGVDSQHEAGEAHPSAIKLAKDSGAVVAITGAVDVITDGATTVRCGNGHPLMGTITGTGCAASASIAAFAGITGDPLAAASAGLAFFGLAGERAAARAKSPGSFMIALIDALYEITPAEFEAGAKLTAE